MHRLGLTGRSLASQTTWTMEGSTSMLGQNIVTGPRISRYQQTIAEGHNAFT